MRVMIKLRKAKILVGDLTQVQVRVHCKACSELINNLQTDRRATIQQTRYFPDKKMITSNGETIISGLNLLLNNQINFFFTVTLLQINFVSSVVCATMMALVLGNQRWLI